MRQKNKNHKEMDLSAILKVFGIQEEFEQKQVSQSHCFDIQKPFETTPSNQRIFGRGIGW